MSQKQVINNLAKSVIAKPTKSSWNKLEKIGLPAVPAFVKCLEQRKEGELRRWAAQALIETIGKHPEHDWNDVIHPLVETLNIKSNLKSRRLRSLASEALARIGPPAVPALMKVFMKEHDTSDALVGIGLPAVPPLIAIVKDRENNQRWYAAVLLADIAKKHPEYDWSAAVSVLIDNLKEKDRNVSDKAAVALVGIGVPAVPALIATMADEKESVRRSAALTLSHIGLDKMNASDRVLCLVILDDQDGIKSMGEAAIPALTACLDNPHRRIRLNAVYALGKIGGVGVVPVIARALKDEHPWIRDVAADNLEEIAETTAVDLRPVKEALKDFVELAGRQGSLIETKKNPKKEAVEHLIRITNAAAKFRAKSHEDGVILVGERPRPSSGRNGMYRAGKQARAVL